MHSLGHILFYGIKMDILMGIDKKTYTRKRAFRFIEIFDNMYPEMLPFKGTENKSGKEKYMRIRIDEKDKTMAGWLKAQKSKTASVKTLIKMASYVYGDRDVTKLGFDELFGGKVITKEEPVRKEIEEKSEEVQPVKVQENTSEIKEEENELNGMLSSML